MFRRTRILQAILPVLLTTACATQPPVSGSATRGSAAATAQAPQTVKASALAGPGAPGAMSEVPGKGLDLQGPIPEIQAGRSEVSNRPFVQPDGTLDPDILQFAGEVAQLRRIPLDQVQALLRDAQYNTTAARLMSPSKTRVRRSWSTYRGRFVEPIRIRAGRQFWTDHASELRQIEQAYGVPASIIVAIIGVETIYGRNTGDFRVLDALATLGFRYPDATRPERSHMFRNQLADLIQLDHQGVLDAREVRGSFAGAMGLPQFMPGSLMRFAADGDRDGVINLHGNPTDAMASVARFLRLHGWVPGIPVFAPVSPPPPQKAQALVTGGLEPTLDWPQIAAAGARPLQPGPAPWMRQPLGIVNLVDEPRNTVEYRVGTPNFFALTHYNRSYFYATSVADLANALEQAMQGDPTTARVN